MRAWLACLAALLVAACGEPTVDNNAFLQDFHNRLADEVTVQGTVTMLLPDSNPASPHENFDILVGGVQVQIIHNLDLAPRVPVNVGDTVIVHGQFEPDSTGAVIHYTHHSTDRHEGGYIQLNGQTYQ